MTIGELLELDKVSKENVQDQAEESSYWATTSNFLVANWDRDIDSLTQRQAAWATKAIDDLVEKRIEGSFN